MGCKLVFACGFRGSGTLVLDAEFHAFVQALGMFIKSQII